MRKTPEILVLLIRKNKKNASGWNLLNTIRKQKKGGIPIFTKGNNYSLLTRWEKSHKKARPREKN